MYTSVNEPSSPETVTSWVSVEDNNPHSSKQSISLLHDKTAVTEPLTGGDHVIRAYRKSPHYLPLACIALLMNPVLGIPALCCALFSRRLGQRGQEVGSARFSTGALWLSLVAMASSVVVIVFAIVYVLVIIPNIVRSIQGFPDGGDYPDGLEGVDGEMTTGDFF